MAVPGFSYIRAVRAFAAVMLACALSGCVMEYGGSCPVFEDGEDSGQLTVRFHIVSDGTGSTKAVTDGNFDPDGHESEGCLADESYVDLSDMRVHLFSKNGSDGFFLQELQTVASGPGTFTASFSVPLEAIADPSGETVSFSLMVLANWGAVGVLYPVFDGNSPLSYITDSAGYGFSMSADWYPLSGTRGIPMYGFMTYSGVSLSALRASTASEPYLLYDNGYGDINLLRAMAKIEVADKIRNRVGEYPRIEDVRIRNWSSNGIFIPTADSFYGAYNQVSKPTLPSDQGTDPAVRTFRKSAAYATVTPDWNPGTMPDGWWTVYCPEIGYSSASAAPELEIMVRNYAPGTAGDGDETTVYTVYLPSDFAKSAGMILRNHVYRLEIVGISEKVEPELEFVYGICEWDRETVQIPDFD